MSAVATWMPAPPKRARWSRPVLALVHLTGVAALIAPMIVPASSGGVAHSTDAPILLALIVPALLAVGFAEVSRGRLDAKGIALLGVLCGLNAALRIPGSLAGASLIFFLPIVCGAVFGSTFGFLLGSLSFAVSAIVTAGIGPWLPFQMLAAGWVGAGGALLEPLQRRGRPVVFAAALALYGWLAGFFFGAVTDLWFWPYLAAGDAPFAWRRGLGIAEGSRAFWRFYVATSLPWDAGRAIGNALMCATLGIPAARMLRRRRQQMWTG